MKDSTFTNNNATSPPLTFADLRNTLNSLPRPTWTHAVEDLDKPGTLCLYLWPQSREPHLQPDYRPFSIVASPYTAERMAEQLRQQAREWVSSQDCGGITVIQVDDVELRRWNQLCKMVHLVSRGGPIAAETMAGIRRFAAENGKTPPSPRGETTGAEIPGEPFSGALWGGEDFRPVLKQLCHGQ